MKRREREAALRDAETLINHLVEHQAVVEGDIAYTRARGGRCIVCNDRISEHGPDPDSTIWLILPALDDEDARWDHPLIGEAHRNCTKAILSPERTGLRGYCTAVDLPIDALRAILVQAGVSDETLQDPAAMRTVIDAMIEQLRDER